MRGRLSALTTILSKSTKNGDPKSKSTSDSGVENSKILPCCHSRLNPLDRKSASRAFIVSMCAASSAFPAVLLFTVFFAAWPAVFSGLASVSGAGAALIAGNSTFRRVPSPSARTISAASSTELRFTSPSQ